MIASTEIVLSVNHIAEKLIILYYLLKIDALHIDQILPSNNFVPNRLLLNPNKMLKTQQHSPIVTATLKVIGSMIMLQLSIFPGIVLLL